MSGHLDEAKKPTPFTRVLNTRSEEKLSQVQEPMKKGKFAQQVFVTCGKLKLQMNLQISLDAQGPITKQNRPEFFSETSNVY